METKKILILSNHFITLYNFRRELISRLIERGHKVYISMPDDERNVFFVRQGCVLIHTGMSRRGITAAAEGPTKPRTVLISREEWRRMQENQE